MPRPYIGCRSLFLLFDEHQVPGSGLIFVEWMHGSTYHEDSEDARDFTSTRAFTKGFCYRGRSHRTPSAMHQNLPLWFCFVFGFMLATFSETFKTSKVEGKRAKGRPQVSCEKQNVLVWTRFPQSHSVGARSGPPFTARYFKLIANVSVSYFLLCEMDQSEVVVGISWENVYKSLSRLPIRAQ